MNKPQIVLAGAIIDFYVNKKVYENYKRNFTKMYFVEKTMRKHFDSLIGAVFNGVEIRSIKVTSNNFYGQKEICFINDIGYNNSNQLPLKEDVLTARIFLVDIVGVVVSDNFDKGTFFGTIKGEGFEVQIAQVKIV